MMYLIFRSWVDSVPPQWWIAMMVVAAVIAFYFLSPILLPIWALMPKWLRWLLGGFVLTIIAYAGGRYGGKKDADALAEKRGARANQIRDNEDAKVKDFDNDRIDRDLRRGGGMRDDPG